MSVQISWATFLKKQSCYEADEDAYHEQAQRDGEDCHVMWFQW
jgi:hypothetical protein